MQLDKVWLEDFRSYTAAEVDLAPGLTAVVGANGQGKSNLLEAIGWLGGLKSFRAAPTEALVRVGAERAIVRGEGVRVVTCGPDGVQEDDVLDAVLASTASEVVVLPNDAALLPVAARAATRAREAGREIGVVPTRSPVQGLAAIAAEKAGILKPGVPAATGAQPAEALDVLAARAAAVGAPLLIRGREWDVEATQDGFVFQDARGALRLPRPGLAGAHQLDNAATSPAGPRQVELSRLLRSLERCAGDSCRTADGVS